MDEESKCVLCGKKESQDTKSDFLRECYMMQRHPVNDRPMWDKGLFQPRLTYSEQHKLHQSGFNYVCHNRTRCRQRQENNYKNKLSKNANS